MRAAGIDGGTRMKRVKNTRADPGASRHPDLAHREFSAPGPKRLWFAEVTLVPTWAAVAPVLFIIDVYSRMIVGWRCASHMRTETVLDAIEMARVGGGTRDEDLHCHSDAGSHSGFKPSLQRWAYLGLMLGGPRPRSLVRSLIRLFTWPN